MKVLIHKWIYTFICWLLGGHLEREDLLDFAFATERKQQIVTCARCGRQQLAQRIDGAIRFSPKK